MPLLCELGPADDVATADDDRDLCAAFGRGEDLLGDESQPFGVDSRLTLPGETLAADLQDNSTVRRVRCDLRLNV